MTDLLIRLVEKLIDLLKHRQGAREGRFNRFVKPIFRDLSLIHQAYVRMFTNCMLAVRNQTELRQVADSLISGRLEQEALRRSVIALAESLASAKQLVQFQAFFVAVREYFYAGRFPRDTRSTALLNEIERGIRDKALDQLHSTEFPVQEIEEFLYAYVDKSLGEIRQAWEELSALYANAVGETLR